MSDTKKLGKELEEARKLLEESQAQAEQSLAGWQRAQADYANLKKETEKRQKDIVEFANATFMSEVLPVYNHFKLAIAHIPEDQRKQDWIVGIDHIKTEFKSFLRKYNIEEIKTVGEKFDPNLHEAVAHEEREGFAEDVIYEEVDSGYMLGDKVIGPAKVKVAK